MLRREGNYTEGAAYCLQEKKKECATVLLRRQGSVRV